MFWLSIVAGAGSLQGIAVLLSILFRLNHGKNLSLALLITALSVRLAVIPLWNAQSLLSRPWLWTLGLPTSLLFAPLIWWHLKDMGGRIPGKPTGLLRHCVPWLAGLTLTAAWIFSREHREYELFLKAVLSGRLPLGLILSTALMSLCSGVYLFLSLLRAYGRDSARLSARKRLWMRSLSTVLLLVLLLSGAAVFFPGSAQALAEGRGGMSLSLSVLLSLFIFMISFFLMAMPELLSVSEPRLPLEDTEIMEHECRILVERLDRRMDEGAFRNPDLSVRDMAAELGVHPNLLSHAVNCYCGSGFRSYLNRKRLACFEEQLLAAADSNRSLLEMAFESGFHSKSTFNRVFREETGLSPTEFARKKKKA